MVAGHYGLYQFSASTWAAVAYGGSPGRFQPCQRRRANQLFANALDAGGHSNCSQYDGCLSESQHAECWFRHRHPAPFDKLARHIRGQTLTCSTVTSDNGMTASAVIAVLVKDQKSQDASETQGWVDLVSGSETGQGSDLDAAAQALGSYSGTQLATDASQFGTDAQTFLSDQSSGLQPGWITEYRQVAADIHKLAADCGQSFATPAGT